MSRFDKARMVFYHRSIVTMALSYKYTYKYNDRFVRRRATNRPGATYNNNKSVRMIKQNSFKSFLEYVSVSNVTCKSDGRVFQAAGPE